MTARLSPLLLLLLCVAVHAQPPLSGEKPIGVFEVRSQAVPLSLEAEEPLILTLEILGKGPTKRAPSRPRLQDIPSLARHFYVEDMAGVAVTPEPNRWTFRYRLKPKSLESRSIPGVPLQYLHPNGQEQTAYSEPILLEVRPRTEKVVVIGPPPVELPEAVRHLATGPEVLRHDVDRTPLAGWVWGLAALVPPAGCWVWYMSWRRRNPDAGRRARSRRSQSAAKALRALHKLRLDGDAATYASEAAAIVTGYLADQLHFAAQGLTPQEASLYLVRADVPAERVAEVAEFFRHCDAIRFAPPSERLGGGLADDAEKLIEVLEAERCFAARHRFP
jgi:hypothetical protein